MAQKTNILKSLTLALILALGFDAVIGAVVGWCWLTVNSCRAWDNRMAPGEIHVAFMKDGTPLMVKTIDQLHDDEYRTLDGNKATLDKKKLEKAWGRPGAGLIGPAALEKTAFPLPYRQRTAAFNNYSGENWYFLHDGRRDGRGYFVGYNNRSLDCVGYLGKQGLQTAPPTEEEQWAVDGRQKAGIGKKAAFFCSTSDTYWFWGGLDYLATSNFAPWKIVMISAGRLIEVDLCARTVRPLGEVKNLLDVEMMYRARPIEESPPSISSKQKPLCLLVRSPERISMLDAEGKGIRGFIIPPEFRDRSFDFYETLGSTAFLFRRLPLPDEYGFREVLMQVDPSGKILQRVEFKTGVNLRPYARFDAWQYALAQPSLVALLLYPGVVNPLIFPFYQDYFSGIPTQQYLCQVIRECWPPLMLILLTSLILAVWCYCRHRRYAQPGAAVWAIFVFLFGLPGLLAYRFHRRWPVLETCVACGKAVPRDRLACAACNARFPTPCAEGH